MKVIITGIAGFIGSNFAHKLLFLKQQKVKDFIDLEITGIDDLSYGIKEQIPLKVDFHKLDIRSKEIYPLFRNVEYVFHFAAKNCISDCQNDPVETADINVHGTVNVFEAAKRGKVKKIIYAESSALYEGSPVLPTPESEAKPQSFYAVSKMATMYFSEAYLRYFGLPYTALRYFCVYGPRQDYRRTIPPVMSAFIIKLLKNEKPIIYGTGKKRRDFVYVDDVNDFHLLCMTDQRTNNRVFNIGSGKNYSVNELYTIISNLLHCNCLPELRNDLPGEAETTLADIQQAVNLGWKPKTELTLGLQTMLDYIRSEMVAGKL
jgi:UDP-glucose 4-epimerase